MPEPLFEGHEGRWCGEHRTLGKRAWCYDCSEYCYPEQTVACVRCLAPFLLAQIERLRDGLIEIANGVPKAPKFAFDLLNEVNPYNYRPLAPAGPVAGGSEKSFAPNWEDDV